MLKHSWTRLRVPFLLSFFLVISGCDFLPKEYQKYGTAIWALIQGTPSVMPSPTSIPSVAPSGTPEEFSSVDANRTKANSELLQEVYRVVFMKDPKDRTEFGSYVDSMNQGASLEGIYNGFTHSSDFRQLETENQGSSSEALRVFSEELAAFQMDLPEASKFDERAAQPLSMPVDPGIPSSGETLEFGTKPFGGPSPSPAAVDQRMLAERYIKIFVGSSIFTLKRILGDEALKVMASKREYREKFALWYGKWVTRALSRKVDFGLELRNKPDEKFHYQWALTATEDRLQWEVLNRVHRILNEANRQKQ